MSAIISPCGLYRYRLEREVQPEGLTFAYFGVNPSTADAVENDATVRKWIGFTLRNGGRRFIVGNVFGFRSKEVKRLAAHTTGTAQGPDWARHTDQIIADADVLVPCWGAAGKIPRHLRDDYAKMLERLLASGKPVLHFGVTVCGQPKHPQMLGYATPLVPWPQEVTQ
ncbi:MULTISPECIES: DUF1643 domain-containing protein [Pseudomonas]|uniref:DUF1643 domain-containing protein n=1 Tax=Pseudomonas TaxID=286 RepID=UPI00076165A0|nr:MULTISPECIES: DUF1643 domain-containing protein [Pseudomonas]MDG9809487.1 DUF1643 domain-containing protein [Pseudomonas juntendi]MDG9815733.1 DUF1643 domain-containing protein [Pseudomonas putida]